MFTLPLCYCLLLALLSGPIGSLILWSRLTFFGETIAHASILGLFFSYLFNTSITLSLSIIVIIYCILLEVFIEHEAEQSQILPIFSYGALGVGFVLIEKFLPSSAALFNVLLGDLLLVSTSDIIFLFGMVLTVWTLWFKFKREILLSLLMPDLATLRRINLKTTNLLRNIITGLAISFVIQASGMLLSMALLTIPPLTAKIICKSPSQMIAITCAISLASIIAGFILGVYLDVSLGATMSCCSLLIFIAIKIIKTVNSRKTFS